LVSALRKPENAGGKERGSVSKPYTRQFREQAVRLVIEGGYTPNRAARELGIADTTLEHWLKKIGYRRQPLVEAPVSNDPKVLAIEVRQLRKQVKELQMEKEILKKATAYFANQNLRDSSS
jgi:transposase